MTTVLDTASPTTAPPAVRGEGRWRAPSARAIPPRAGMSRLAALPLGSAVEVAGGVLVSARVRSVRHDPSGSTATLVGRCPERLGAASGSVLASRPCPGPLQEMTLRWGADGTTTRTRLPVEAVPEDVVVVFSPRHRGRSWRRLALAGTSRTQRGPDGLVGPAGLSGTRPPRWRRAG